MCNFMSAIYLRTGKLICKPEFTNSHSDLIKAYIPTERNTTAPVQQFVKLELTPPDALGEITEEALLSFDKWIEVVDHSEVPEWFDEAARFDAFEQMRDILRVAANRTGELQYGGLSFCRSKESIGCARVFALSGARLVVWGGSRAYCLGGSKVVASDCSHAVAFKGSHVHAMEWSRVVAEPGSEVVKYPGSEVVDKPGALVSDAPDKGAVLWM